MTLCLRRMIFGQFGQLGTDEFLLTRGLESWICNYLEQLDEIPEVKHINFVKELVSIIRDLCSLRALYLW